MGLRLVFGDSEVTVPDQLRAIADAIESGESEGAHVALVVGGPGELVRVHALGGMTERDALAQLAIGAHILNVAMMPDGNTPA